MGDILHALPAVTALRVAHPGLTLGWACEPQWRALFAAESSSAPVPGSPAQPLVDHLHLVPAKAWAKRPLGMTTLTQLLACRRELRQGGYDAALDLQGAVRSAMLARWARPRRLLGEAAPRESAARWLFQERVPSNAVHVIEQAGDVVRALFRENLALGLPMLPQDVAAQQWCREAGVPGSGNSGELRVLVHPGAGWGSKRWPAERYALAAAQIGAATGARIVVHAAPGEIELAESVAAGLKNHGVHPLVLTPTIGQLIELTRRMTLVIGGDTGPLHLAAALGKPTIGIFGPTDPARNGPYHGEFRIFRDALSRRDHTRRSNPELGLLRIAPEGVAEAAIAMLRQLQAAAPQGVSA